MDTKPCKVCGLPVVRNGEGPGRWETRKFCSRECWRKSRIGVLRPELYRRVMKTCLACGTIFETGGRSAHPKVLKFCSRKCSANARWRTGSRTKDLTIAQAAYLAGIIDGEGSIMILHTDNCFIRVAIANTNERLMTWCKETTGVGNYVTKPAPAHGRHKASYQLMINSTAAETLLAQIRPYLVIKGEQADLALEFQRKLRTPAEKVQKEWQQQWRLQMHGLNARGPRP